jgi:hypothetical protein
MFVLCANVLGDSLGFMSVAVGWAIGYPLAFIALSYLVVKGIRLPLGPYLRGAWGIVGCCLAGLVVGFGVSLALADAGPGVRLVAVGGSALVVILLMLAFWQDITPKSITRSLKG